LPYVLECGLEEGVGRDGAMDRQHKEVLTAEEAAEFLGFNPVTIRLKARAGEIPGRKVGKEWRFSRRRLLEWLEEGDREQMPV
jgi:excisionase family DNA binding protein